MTKYAYGIFIGWTVIFILLFVSGFISFGHGMGDVIYACYVVVFFILISLVRYRVLGRRKSLVMECIFSCVIALFIGYVLLELTLFRGPEYIWNGRVFYYK